MYFLKNKTKTFWLLVLMALFAWGVWNYAQYVEAQRRFESFLMRTPAPSLHQRAVQKLDSVANEIPTLLERYEVALSREDYPTAVGISAMIIDGVEAQTMPHVSSAAAELWAGYALLRAGDAESSEAHLLRSWQQAVQPYSGDAAWLLALVAMQRQQSKEEEIWLLRAQNESQHYAFLAHIAAKN